MAFTTNSAPYCSADGSGLLIPPLVNRFHNGLRAVLLSGWQRIAHTSARQRLSRRFARLLLSGWRRIAHSFSRQRLSRRFARRIAQRMAAHCSFFRSSTAFLTVRAPYCSADGSGLLILPLANSFHDGLRAVLLSGWYRIAQSSARQRLSRRFARRIAHRMARQIAHSFSRQRLSRRFALRIAQRMAADCSYLRSSTSLPTVCALYCSAACSALLILPLVNGFSDGLCAVLLSGRQRIAHSSARQRLSRWFSRRIAQRMVADSSYLRSSTAFPTLCPPYCSADDSALLILPLINGFPDGSHAVLRSGWQWIAHTSARQRLSPRFARRIAQRMSADCSFFRSSSDFTVCAPFCSANGSGLLILPVVDVYYPRPVRVPYSSADGSGLLILALVNGLHDGFSAVLLSRWLGRSLICLLVNGFHDGLCTVLLCGW